MAKFHQGDSPTLLACLSRYRDCVQRIMLALRLKIYNSHQSFHRRRYFLLYAIFAEMIFRQAAASQAPVRTFLLRDIIHTAVHILQQVPAFKANAATRLLTGARRCQLLLVGACCHLLTVVCRPAVTSCVDVSVLCLCDYLCIHKLTCLTITCCQDRNISVTIMYFFLAFDLDCSPLLWESVAC